MTPMAVWLSKTGVLNWCSCISSETSSSSKPLMRARSAPPGGGRDWIKQGSGQAIHLIRRCRLARARAPTRPLQARQGFGDALVEAIFDDAQGQGIRQRLVFGAL